MSSLLIAPGPVTVVTLNRPEVRNALDEAMIAELTTWARQVPTDGSVRIAVLQGAGSVFCAGADLGWMRRVSGYSREENVADALDAADMFLALDTLPIPLVGRVHGAAIGGAVGLAAICDIVITAADTQFGLAETQLGLVPAMIAPYLVRKMGLSATRALGLSGGRFTAARARDVGLVHEVIDATDLDAAVNRVVRTFGQTSPAAVTATKRLLASIAHLSPAEARHVTAEAIADARMSPDGREGLQAFFDKRPPRWTEPLDRRAALGPARKP